MKKALIICIVILVACGSQIKFKGSPTVELEQKDDTTLTFVMTDSEVAMLTLDTIIPIDYDFSLKDTAVFTVQTVLADSLFIVLDITYDSESVPTTNSSGILTKTETLEELTRLRRRYVRQRKLFKQRWDDVRGKITELDSIRVQIEGV